MDKCNIVVVIQSRLSSKRLPAKALLPIANIPSVVLCARRAQNTGFPVIVATSTHETDDSLAEILYKNGVYCFRGSLDDVLSRMTQAVSSYNDNDLIVRLTADNVFPDGKFINLLIKQFEKEQYDYLGTASPKDRLPYGMSAEVFKISALREANNEASTAFEREHVTPYIKRYFRCKQFVYKDAPVNWQSLRCTLDTFEDYTNLINVFKRVDNPVDILWEDLIRQLEYVNNAKVSLEKTKRSYKKLTFGAVQLGIDYGIANQNGLPDEEKALALIQKAIIAGVSNFDTARAYGLSEQRLGRALDNDIKKSISIISKLHPLDYLSKDANEKQVRFAVRASIYESCYQLKLSKIDTLLLHRWEHRFKWKGVVWDELLLLKKCGVIKQLGVSVNNPDEVIEALQDLEIKHIQCPVNILDWRWRQNAFLGALAGREDVLFFARSIYLQGLLTLQANKWPDFPEVDKVEINTMLDNLVLEFNRVNRKDLCIAYVQGLPWVDSLVLGMETETQLQENLELFDKLPLTLEQIEEINQILPTLPESFLNPARWKL